MRVGTAPRGRPLVQGSSEPQRSPEQQLPTNPAFFGRGSLDTFRVTLPDAPVSRLFIRHDNSGQLPAWFLQHVALQPVSSATHPKKVFFSCFQWLQVRCAPWLEVHGLP